ncbi:hypothetical protein HNQ51_003666 [Inhella inkyongensis]|uniref:Tail specific protease domain-containing protein n=1 Tax=Inhella inkyongensis TaxID=392593 RepID=A0A840SDA2_9BURK|nr:S41 family peptidase [Inhella inkyongensis]MBB5206320.1 hypothetical protein [Inhella inkyongensis]
MPDLIKPTLFRLKRPLTWAYTTLSLLGLPGWVQAMEPEPGPKPAPTQDWAALTLKDVQFTAQALRERHAGVVAGKLDATAPMDQELPLALQAAAQARNENDHRRILRRLISAFSDPHTGLYLQPGQRRWAGLIVDAVGASGAEFRVVATDKDWPTPLPQVGARVKACDGLGFGSYLRTQVAPLVDTGPEYPSAFSAMARRSMFDSGLGWAPKQCSFVHADGSEQVLALTLREIGEGSEQVSEARLELARKGLFAQARPVGLERLSPTLHWVGMPDYNPGTSNAAYEQLYKQLTPLAGKPGWVVFDLRGNGGGSTQLGNRALKALYGEDFGAALNKLSSNGKWMVAHPSTVALYESLLDKPELANVKKEIEHELKAMRDGLARGERLVVANAPKRPEEVDAQRAAVRKRPGGPRIAAVIDRGCFSSCMGVLLQMQAIADTVVLGEPTIGYSPYGEIGEHKLPSGRGSLYLPSALFAAPQATREPFVPQIPYPGRMADDKALMAWVKTTLEQLAKGPAPAPRR